MRRPWSAARGTGQGENRHDDPAKTQQIGSDASVCPWWLMARNSIQAGRERSCLPCVHQIPNASWAGLPSLHSAVHSLGRATATSHGHRMRPSI